MSMLLSRTILPLHHTVRSIQGQILRTMHLQQSQAFVNGRWVGARGGQTFDVTNPANERVIGTVPDMDVSDANEAIDAAYSAFYDKQWHNSTAKERAALLKVRDGCNMVGGCNFAKVRCVRIWSGQMIGVCVDISV